MSNIECIRCGRFLDSREVLARHIETYHHETLKKNKSKTTFPSISSPTVCRPVSPQSGDEFAWHTKQYWLVHAELKWAYWMGEWEIKNR